jgi:hypothetical protein
MLLAPTVATRPPAPGRIAPGSSLHYYSGNPSGINHHHATPQKPPVTRPPFDFSISEARLLLTQFPRVARPRNSPRLPRRLSPPRILPDRGLTNGLSAVIIDCMHGANQALPQSSFPRMASTDARTPVAGRVQGWRWAYIRLEVAAGGTPGPRHGPTSPEARRHGSRPTDVEAHEPRSGLKDAEIGLGVRRAFSNWVDRSTAGLA